MEREHAYGEGHGFPVTMRPSADLLIFLAGVSLFLLFTQAPNIYFCYCCTFILHINLTIPRNFALESFDSVFF